MYFGKQKPKQDNRVPPDQNVTTGFPVLTHGDVPIYKDLSKWNLRVFGLVETEVTYSYRDMMKFPQQETFSDIHCVTGWSKLDNRWQGIATKDLLEGSILRPEAKFVILHAEYGYTANLPIEDFLQETSMLAHSHNGKPLTPEHGFPFRAVIPHLYFWKSAKWVRGIEFTDRNEPGFWEKNGYHMYGDPWKSERFSFD